MMYLITVAGKSAKQFFLRPECMADFESLIRSVTSDRVMVVSTRFRTDIFYRGSKPRHEAILKLWALYAYADPDYICRMDFRLYDGDEDSLASYFEAIDALSANWYYYNLYKKVFSYVYSNDQHNPLAVTIANCDKHLVALPCTKRTPLVGQEPTGQARVTLDTLAFAMTLVNNQSHIN